MMFVPVTSPPPVSLEVQELAREIENAIVRYQDEHPRTTQADIQVALRLAQSTAGRNPAVAPIAVGVAVGVVLLVGILTLLLFQGGDMPWIAISGLGVLVVAIVPLILLLKTK